MSALEAAAKAYYEQRPLQGTFNGQVFKPLPWDALIASTDPVRAESLKRHRQAMAAAIKAYEASK